MKSLGISYARAAMILLCGAFVAPCTHAGVLSFSGPVANEDPAQLPGGVSGIISWSISDDILTISAQNTTGSALPNQGWALSAFHFDVSGDFVLNAQTAFASALLHDGEGTTAGPVDVGDFWAAKESISAFGLDFDWGVSGVGDLGGTETFGADDIINGRNPSQPNGADYTIVPGAQTDTFNKNASPLIRDTVTVTFSVTSALGMTMTMSDIQNMTPSFGTDGNEIISEIMPEPMSLAIWGVGILGLAGARRRRKSKKA